MTIERFDPLDPCDLSARMEADSDGDWVRFYDHEEAIDEVRYDLKELQKKYDKLVEKLGDLYREG